MTGRPSKLTRALLDKLDAIADDQWSIRDACATLDIGETTWRRWEADTHNDDEHAVAFRRLAARVREGSGSKIGDLAWGALRTVLEDDGQWVEGPDGEREYLPGPKASDKIAAAAAILRLQTAHKVEHSGSVDSRVDIRLPKGAGDAAIRFVRELGEQADADGDGAS